MTDILKSELFSPWIKAYPVTEPLIDVFIRTMDETVKSSIEHSVDSVARTIIQHPDNAQSTVSAEAAKLVSQAEIKNSPAIVKKADQLGKKMEQELANLKVAKVEIDNAIKQAENSRIEKQIVQLHSPNEAVRKTAAQNLSSMGPKLSQTKVKELIDIMRHGNTKWITSRTRQEGHHCTDYEYTSIRYYAATAISDMKSPYVSTEISQEAVKRQSDSVTTERVTDPGWV